MEERSEASCDHCQTGSCLLWQDRGRSSWLMPDELPRSIVFAPRQPIYSAEIAAHGCYLVCEGSVRLALFLPSGDTVVTDIMGPGGVFGLETLVSERYHMEAQALGETHVAYFSKQSLSGLLQRYPWMSSALIEHTINQTRSLRQRLVAAACRGAREKLARLLIDLSHSLGGTYECKTIVGITQGELACMLGISRETVSTLLREFKKDDLVSVQDRRIVILDESALSRI